MIKGTMRNICILTAWMLLVCSCSLGGDIETWRQKAVEANKTKSGLQMVWVPGGSFQMGSNDSLDYDASPPHTVTLTGFYMSRTEVTQAQWQAVMGTTIQQQNDISSYPGLYGVGDNYPMYHVSWYDALDFTPKGTQD